MAKDFLNDFPSFSLDMHHLYKMHGEDWRFAYNTNGTVTFSEIDDPRKKLTYEIGILNRLNAAGEIHLIPYGMLPEHLRPAPVQSFDDIVLAGLAPAHRNRVEGRHSMVQSFLYLYESGEMKGTDEAIIANMTKIREGAEKYLAEELPDPEYALQVKLAEEGKGRKPESRSLVSIPDKVSPRALRGWVSLYRKGGKKALVDNCAKQGNVNSYFTADEVSLMVKTVKSEYFVLGGKPVKTVIVDVKHAFRKENERRAEAGEPPLRTPGRDAVSRFIKNLDKFHVLVAHFGQEEAMKRMRPVKDGIEVRRPFERVEMDEWKVDLLTIMAASGLLAMFSKEELEEMGLLDRTKRWWLVAAIDCRTRCIVGMTLTANPKTSGAIKCLKMVTSDKGQFADAVGALTPWSMFGKPEILAVDNGSAFKAALFTTTCADIGITKLQTIAGQPSMRGRIERLFHTMALSLFPRLSGRTFGNTVARAKHPSEKRACLTVDDLAYALVRWGVDVYHNTPHEGLGGRTPLQQWEADLEDGNFPLHIAPGARQKRLAFGLPLKRIVQQDGIRALNVQYHSGDLARWYLKHGSQQVQVRWFDEDLGVIEAFLDGSWTEIPSSSDAFKGVDATTWAAARRALRARDPSARNGKRTSSIAPFPTSRR